jgi:hypothetical protein
MKRWTAAAALAALVAAGGFAAIDAASAAKIITVQQRAQPADEFDPGSQRGIPRRAWDERYRQDEQPAPDERYRQDDQPHDGGWTYYYGRPYFYVPAPFPLGFDFGFGW